MKIDKAPDNPGIYLFYNADKKLIYVGKATSLKSRIKSYFSSGSKTNRPIELLIKEVEDVKWKETESVIEATILEANYIKKYSPKYNVLGKDDKSWNYLYLTEEEFPKLKTVREHQLKEIKKAKYIFGPYPNIKTSEMLKILHNLFSISRCEKGQKKPCFDYQLGRCLGVCTGEIDAKEYKKIVINPLISFLRGNKKRVILSLEKEMKNMAGKEKFEKAAEIKKRIERLKKIQDISLISKDFFEELKEEDRDLRIEGYDISNLQENFKVGSMVVLKKGELKKQEYKRFKIRTVEKQSDIDCLKEVLERRLSHREWPYPQIILVDGGTVQVKAFEKILEEHFLNIPVFGIAKGKTRKKNEFIYFFKDKKIEAFIKEHKDLLISLRDEAHRFAISYQRKLSQFRF